MRIIQEGSLAEERVFSCELSTLGSTMEDKAVAPPAVIVIGEVAGL